MEAEIQTKSFPTAEPDEDLSMMIIELISDLEGVDPVELSPPLYSVINPEALDALFHSASSDAPQTSGHVQFVYCGYEIRVQSDGEIAVLNR
ncbi:HalOD1 output domain-containing protein [Natrinema sp. HArc-T2]|uniref:HalOD1 output domain-containing protein n=1 Tax=Natrinema sp. HArc-T2 TaxID=3242701 RepID=UPI00359DB5DF